MGRRRGVSECGNGATAAPWAALAAGVSSATVGQVLPGLALVVAALAAAPFAWRPLGPAAARFLGPAAERLVESEPGTGKKILAEARSSSAAALAELRYPVRGINPPVLAERGLVDAVRVLALEAPVKATVRSGLTAQSEQPVETAVYFAAAELSALSERENSVLALMAEGLSDSAIASRLHLSEGAISEYTTTIFAKLGLTADEDTNRRVRAVLAYLQAE